MALHIIKEGQLYNAILKRQKCEGYLSQAYKKKSIFEFNCFALRARFRVFNRFAVKQLAVCHLFIFFPLLSESYVYTPLDD